MIKLNLKKLNYIAIILFVTLAIACSASQPPKELTDARDAYRKAETSQAEKYVPAELHKAKDALNAAENSFKDDSDSFTTKDLAYIADRKAKLAEVQAESAMAKENATKAKEEFQALQAKLLEKSKDKVSDLEKSDALKSEKLAAEQRARLEAEARAAKAQADLAKLAAKEEERGLVITLSGSVLFQSNKSALLPQAQAKLNEVADALLATKERRLIVEGHTDSQGSDSHNLTLSQQRAESVRSFLISRGYDAGLIEAKGIGESRPIADNSSPEGRANNRRVEIIIQKKSN